MAEPIATVGDLAGICGHDGTNWEKVLIDASKRLVVAVDAFTATLEVTQDTPGDLLTGVHHYDGSAWRKSNLLWGYHAIWDENLGGTATGATWTASTSTIPAGEIWVLQAVSCRNNTRDPTNIALAVTRDSGAVLFLNWKAAPGAQVPVLATGAWALQAGDVVSVTVNGCVADDIIKGGVIGYKMDIAM